MYSLGVPLAFVRPLSVAVVSPMPVASSVTAVGAPNIDVPSLTRRRMLSKFAIVLCSATVRIAVSNRVLSSRRYVCPEIRGPILSFRRPSKVLSESLRTSLYSSVLVAAVWSTRVHV